MTEIVSEGGALGFRNQRCVLNESFPEIIELPLELIPEPVDGNEPRLPSRIVGDKKFLDMSSRRKTHRSDELAALSENVEDVDHGVTELEILFRNSSASWRSGGVGLRWTPKTCSFFCRASQNRAISDSCSRAECWSRTTDRIHGQGWRAGLCSSWSGGPCLALLVTTSEELLCRVERAPSGDAAGGLSIRTPIRVGVGLLVHGYTAV